MAGFETRDVEGARGRATTPPPRRRLKSELTADLLADGGADSPAAAEAVVDGVDTAALETAAAALRFSVCLLAD